MLQATQLHLQDWTSSRGGSVDRIDLNYVNFSFNFSFLRPLTHLTRSNHCVPGFHLLIQKNCVKSGYTSSKTSLPEIDRLNCSGNMLAFSSLLFIQIHISLASESPELRYILLLSVHMQVRSHFDTLLVRDIARILWPGQLHVRSKPSSCSHTACIASSFGNY